MMPEKARHLMMLANRMSDALMTAALCSQEIKSELDADIGDGNQAGISKSNDTNPNYRPVLDESTLSVIWRGKTLHLGHTRSFWLLARLSRCPNQYVKHLDLLKDVWDNEDAPADTIRSVVRHLRGRLTKGGMGDLAESIRGHSGRYILQI